MKKKNNFFQLFLVLLLGFTFVHCKTKVNTTGDPVPKISFKSMNSSSVKQFTDSVYATISYIDGDGDLGNNDPDKYDIEIKDSRFSKPDYFYLAPLAPLGSKISIEGELKIKLTNLFLSSTAQQETVTFEIRLRDRAGNYSNTVKTPAIVISK